MSASAEGVILQNLKRILSDPNNAELLSSMEDLNTLKESVGIVKGAVAALLEEGGHLNGSSLGNLGALLHQADDLLDEIIARYHAGRLSGVAAAPAYQQDGNLRVNLGRALQRAVSASNRVTEKVGLHIHPIFPSTIIRQISKLSQDLGELGKQLDNKHGSIDLPESSIDPQPYTLSRNKVIGRDRRKLKIINRLLTHRENETSVSVIPIIGSPGVGKSALAQLVYEDERVQNHFDIRMWIQVSQISDEKEIIREIVESCTNRRASYRQSPKAAKSLHSRVHQNQHGSLTFRDILRCQSINTFDPNNKDSKDVSNIYERRLRKEVEGKLYLLVLDGACITQGQRLKDLLAAGATGSRILLTTRHFEGGFFAKSEIVKSCKLKGLSKRISRDLFKTFAFGSREDERYAALVETGHEIADNCGGVPLILKVAASFLYNKDAAQWSSFNEELRSDARHEKDKMIHVLHVSYNDLPTRLKACLNYCSLFPEDFRFNKHDLISLWIAQGFIHPPEQGNSLEEAAEQYFMELSRRCFFEDVITDRLGKIVTCKMHHIMRSIACQYSAGIMNLHMTDTGVNLDSTCKHVSLTCDQESLRNLSSSVLQAQTLRTLLLVKEPDCDTKIDSLDCNMLISSFKRLRVLDLHDLGIEKLPISIGKLIHLRYLDLSRNDGLVTLPKSVTELYNLQTLKLNSCTKLRRLPSNFGQLTNLTRFEVDECDSLTGMPLGLEKLIQLETMTRFVVGQEFSKEVVSSGLKALEKLNNLRGRLAIEFTKGWKTTIPEAKEAMLVNKIHLDELKISWEKTALNRKDNSHLLSDQEKSSYEVLLDNLQPFKDLKILCIEGYKGQDFPNWIGVERLASSLPKLEDISIEGCDKCEHLPPFGKLKHLKRLTLRHMANVQYVQTKFAPASPFFQELEELTLHNFYKLEGWWEEEMSVTPENRIPSFPNLSKLRIWNCPKLRSMPLFSGVSELDLRNVNQMLLEQSSKNFPTDIDSNVKCLQIKGCSTLRSFTTVRKGLGGRLPSLRQLVIEKCHALSSLASELPNLNSLEKLEISNCKELDLSDYESNDMENGNPWKSLEHLHHLTLREIPKMKSLPENLKHVSTLKSLWISACTSLTELPQWISNLTALQHLRIESCEAVTRLPDGLKEVTSLKKVEITECSALMECCREYTGEDWHKIKHARVLLHKSWRYGHMPELGASQNRSNVQALTDVKYIIIPIIAAGS
ncbi:putative disease resistance protein RGA3 [Chenopodium quinoa]|uniref:putative disease resistance protein RGA3 n=1 Tax=Chenopodium quinoa TaxID=63459 RepID=UPI000B792D61|nr:putative disease resistance protein RGA3 [Chenopodium quinoa]